jgi:UDPglucose 6-dehydrogenase
LVRVTMIGAGYVGLVSGACLADFGHHVTCIDRDARRIAALKRGAIPIFEPGLPELVGNNVRQGRLEFDVELSRGGGSRFYRGRDAVAPGRRSCRPDFRL